LSPRRTHAPPILRRSSSASTPDPVDTRKNERRAKAGLARRRDAQR
jgi:hypothetical protein